MPLRPAGDVAIHIGRSSSSDDFEEIQHPNTTTSWQRNQDLADEQQQHLPLHYSAMSEEKARRRVVNAAPATRDDGNEKVTASTANGKEDYYDDDEGKDVYAKLRPKYRVGSGRVAKPPPPPPTSLVRLIITVMYVRKELTMLLD
jgi:dolichyl-phosphate-mannose-protein mannosyltransferase